MSNNLSYFSDNEELEWLANLDQSLLDKSNKEKQLDNSEISSFIYRSWIFRSALHILLPCIPGK